MTLGEFKKITEQYADDCRLQIRTENGYGSASSELVTRVIITTDDPTDADDAPARPLIEVQAL